MNTGHDIYRQAQKRVNEKKRFYKHFSSYLIMGSFFFILNMITSPFDWWFMFPMLGWGIGLAFHYVKVFGLPFLNFNDKDWEEKQLEKELRQLGGSRREDFLEDEDHQIDVLDLDNNWKKKPEEDFSRFDHYDDRDLREIRRDFDDEFGRKP